MKTNKKTAVEAIFYIDDLNMFMTVDYHTGVITYDGVTTRTKYLIGSTKKFNKLKRNLAKIGAEYVGTSIF